MVYWWEEVAGVPMIEMIDTTRTLQEFIEALMEVAREYGRCVSCGFVFCDHNDHLHEYRALCWPRVCWLEDAPTSST